MKPLRVLHIAAEAAPYAKAGGLADVIQGLSHYLAADGHDVRVVLPDYAGVVPRDLHKSSVGKQHTLSLAGSDVDYRYSQLQSGPGEPAVYLVECDRYFGQGGIYGSGDDEVLRFGLLCQAALQLCHDLDWAPQVIHCHDWHTAIVPQLLQIDREQHDLFAATRSVLTIHNIGYQGVVPISAMQQAGFGAIAQRMKDAPDDTQVNLLRTGIRHADALTTVSPTHAREILTPAYGMGLDQELRNRSSQFTGILNGADYRHWDPMTDALLPARFGPGELAGKQRCRQSLEYELHLDLTAGAPLAGMVSRLVDQKGVDLVVAALPELLTDTPLGLAVLGDGDPKLVSALRDLADAHPDRVAFVHGYDEALAHRILGGSDLLLVPSRYEPCGLTQMYAMHYGTVPVVRETGGLADTVQHFDPGSGQGTGSVFKDADPGGLRWALATALDWHTDAQAWDRVQANGMAADFSWQRQGPLYAALYAQLVAGH